MIMKKNNAGEYIIIRGIDKKSELEEVSNLEIKVDPSVLAKLDLDSRKTSKWNKNAR